MLARGSQERDGSLVAFSGKGDLCDWYTNDVLETADDVDFAGG